MRNRIKMTIDNAFSFTLSMNQTMSKSSTFGTFQISTDQIQLHRQSHSESKIVRVNEDEVRIDASTEEQRSPHFRALQLDEFTDWLNQQPSSSSQTSNTTPPAQTPLQSQTATPRSILNSTPKPQVPGLHPKKTFRVDAPVSRSQSIVARPNFDTENYIADPKDIEKTIRQLKSDGRIIADHDQLTEETIPPTERQSQTFDWPVVTDRLVGNSAILNLELNIQSNLKGASQQLIVCSIEPGSGATTIAMSLARQLSHHGQQVLLIDADLNNAILASRLGIRHHDSWVRSISQRRALPEIIIRDKQSNVSLLPLSSLKSVAWPRRTLDQLANIITSVAYDFDIVIFDVGTYSQLLQESDSPANLASLTLLVSGTNHQNSDQNAQVRTSLSSAGLNNVIIVENFSSAQHSKVG